MKKISAKKQIKDLTAQVKSLTDTVQNQTQVIAAAENAAYGDGVPSEGPASNSLTVERIASQVSYLKADKQELQDEVDQAYKQVGQVREEATKVLTLVTEKASAAIEQLKEAAEVNATAAQRRDTMVQAFIDLTNKGPLTDREQAIFRAGFVVSTIDDVKTAEKAAGIPVIPASISGNQPKGLGGMAELIAALGASIGGGRRPQIADFGGSDDDFGGNPFGS